MKTLRALLFVLTCALTGTVHAGALQNGVCYQTNVEALNAYYASTEPKFVSGTDSWLVLTSFESNAWLIKWYRWTGVWSLYSSTPAPIPLFPACDPLEKFKDSIKLAWLVVGCLLVGFTVKHIRSTL